MRHPNTHRIDWERETGEGYEALSIVYTITGGCPAHYGSLTYPGHPAEAPEVEIVRVTGEDRRRVELTEEEAESAREFILDRHQPPEIDRDYDPVERVWARHGRAA